MDLRPIGNADMKMLSRSVQIWYRYYGAKPDQRSSKQLCQAAIALFNQGYNTTEELARLLINKYPGPVSVLANAPSSIAIH
jgi:hypothetical protein